MGQNEGWALGAGNHLGHGEGFARTGDPQKHLVLLALVDTADQFLDRGRLIAAGIELRGQPEFDAAFGLVRAFRAVRHPGLVIQLLAAMFDQR